MLDPLSKDAQCESFNARHSFFACLPINHGARYLGNLSDPPTVFLLFNLDSKKSCVAKMAENVKNSILFDRLFVSEK